MKIYKWCLKNAEVWINPNVGSIWTYVNQLLCDLGEVGFCHLQQENSWRLKETASGIYDDSQHSWCLMNVNLFLSKLVSLSSFSTLKGL